jgi:molybdopterin-containing oxidoreductase family iron-sulfur binding subunit
VEIKYSKHIVYDAVSSSEDAFEAVYGERALVDYDFSKASLIVSVGADILGDWQGGGYDSGYTQGRILKRKDVTPLSIRGEYDAVWCCC